MVETALPMLGSPTGFEAGGGGLFRTIVRKKSNPAQGATATNKAQPGLNNRSNR
jgi:hypothetical protein